MRWSHGFIYAFTEMNQLMAVPLYMLYDRAMNVTLADHCFTCLAPPYWGVTVNYSPSKYVTG